MFEAKTDAQLCGLSAGGSAEAFTELVRRTQGAVCAVTYAATGRRDISEDLAQETYLVAWRKLRERELEEPDKVAGWLCGIGRNLARKTKRERVTEPLDGGLVDDDATMEDVAAEQQRRDRVWELLAELPPRYREVMILHYRQEQSASRVAELLGLTVSAAEQRLSRGRKMLRAKVERALGDELARSRPTEAFTRRVASALPVGALAPAASPTTSTLSPWTKAISMKTITLTSLAIATTLAVGYVALDAPESPTTTPTTDAAAPTPARATPREIQASTASEPSSLAGLVVAADSGDAISGAVITIVEPGRGVATLRSQGGAPLPAVIRSDDEGGWSVSGLAAGRYAAVARAPGRLPLALPPLTVSSGETVRELRFELSAGGLPLSGVVSDAGGGPIAGATVRAKSRTGFPVSAITDDEGHYQLHLPHGRYEISIWDLGYQEEGKPVSLEGAGAEVDFELVPAATIAGRVLDRATGQPVPGAEISFERMVRFGGGFSSNRSDPEEIATADESGRFVLRRLSPAEYSLSASADHVGTRAPEQVNVGIADQVDDVVIFVDPAFNITGRVVSEDDPSRGIEGARVRTLSKSAAAYAVTGPDGGFVLRGLQPDAYPMMVEGDGVIPSMMKVSVTIDDADEDGVEVPLESGTTISGRVDPPGAAEVRLALHQSTGGFDVMLLGQKIKDAKTTAAPDGSFTLPAAPRGTWKLIAETVDGAQGEVDVEVDGEALDGVRVQTAPRPFVGGRVVDTQGAPLGQLTVRLQKDVGDVKGPMARMMARSGSKTTTTDATGSFALVGLEAGRYTLAVQDHRGAEFLREGATAGDLGRPIEIAEDPIDELELRVRPPNQSITGVVLDSEGTPQPDAWVRLSGTGDSASWRFPVEVTDADGQFAFDALAEGSYDISVRANRSDAFAEQEDVAAGGSIELTLATLGAVRGVVMSNGSPVTSFTVDAGLQNARTFYAEDGRFEMQRLKPGYPLVTVTTTDGGTGQRVAVTRGEATEVTFDVGAWATVEGRAVDADGNPVAGLTLGATSNGGVREDRQRFFAEVSGEGGVVTGPDGRFSFDGVGAGRGEIALFQPGGARFGNRVDRGGTLFYVEPGAVTNIGEIQVLAEDTVSREERGTLAMTVRAGFDRPRTSREDDYVEPTGRPTGEPKLFVTSIYDDGPASDANVRSGAQILAIDGEPVDEIGATNASRLLQSERLEADQVVRLRLSGPDGEPRTVELRAARNAPR